MFALITTRSTPRFPGSGRLLSIHGELSSAAAYRRSLQQAERSATGATHESDGLRIVVLTRPLAIGDNVREEWLADTAPSELAPLAMAAAHSRTRRGPR